MLTVQFLSVVAGVGILVGLLLEVLWTTMGLGGGVLTKTLSSWLHHAALKLYPRVGKRLFLAWLGILIMMVIFVVWIGLLWLGWTLIFSGVATTVVSTETGIPADFWERAYFVGFSIFTLGLGDYRPQGHLWQILTAVATLHGLFSVTFAITYLVPIVQAATQLHQTAVTIASLGLSGHEIILNTWNGRDCSELGEYLVNLVPVLAQLEQRHLTYPVLHYFHAVQNSASLALGVTALDEALTIIEFGLHNNGGLSIGRRHPARQVITEFLNTIDEAYIHPTDETPPGLSLAPLRAAGIPVVSDDEFNEQIASLSTRRRLLAGFVRSKGWRWTDTQMQVDGNNPDQPLNVRHQQL